MSDAPTDATLDVARIVEVLNRHKVAYVVIGGVAAAAWALSQGVAIRPTEDIDITPEATRANLDRLSDALRELDAHIRADGVPGGLAFDHDGSSLGRGATWNLLCRHGPFDISITPSGTEGFVDLAQRARIVTVDGVEAPLADLADIIRSKRAAGRPKDHAVLPSLEEALRRRDGT